MHPRNLGNGYWLKNIKYCAGTLCHIGKNGHSFTMSQKRTWRHSFIHYRDLGVPSMLVVPSYPPPLNFRSVRSELSCLHPVSWIAVRGCHTSSIRPYATVCFSLIVNFQAPSNGAKLTTWKLWHIYMSPAARNGYINGYIRGYTGGYIDGHTPAISGSVAMSIAISVVTYPWLHLWLHIRSYIHGYVFSLLIVLQWKLTKRFSPSIWKCLTI